MEAIRLYISGFRPRAADRVAAGLLMAGDGLAELPERGRPISRGLRQLMVAPYLLTYRVEPSRVIILRVRHGARRKT